MNSLEITTLHPQLLLLTPLLRTYVQKHYFGKHPLVMSQRVLIPPQ